MRNKRQARTKLENRQNILKVLTDNQWHSYKEIYEKADISNVTLSEHLKELKPLLDKRKDASTNRRSRQYKIKPLFALILANGLVIDVAGKEIKQQIQSEKDFALALKSINGITDSLLTATLYILANENYRDDSEVIKLVLETFVWESYKSLTWKFVEAVREYMNKERAKRAKK
jgi:hypothetical protein